MAYSQLPTRSSSDTNASADINQLQDNFDNHVATDGTYLFTDNLRASSASGLSIGNDNNTLGLFIDDNGGEVCIGTSTKAVSGASLTVYSSNNNSRIYMQNSTTGTGANGIFFIMDGNNFSAINQENGYANFFTNNTERLRISSDGKLSTGAESSPDCSAGGLTLQQNTEDGNILTFKSTDVNHGGVGGIDSDSFMLFRKLDATGGGCRVTSILDGDESQHSPIEFALYSRDDLDTTKTNAANGAFNIVVRKHDGAGSGANVNAGGNLFVIEALTGGSTNAVFIVDAEGDTYADSSVQNSGTASQGYIEVYDNEDDISLARAAQLVLGKQIDKVIPDMKDKLQELGIMSGTMYNMRRMFALCLGSIKQLHDKNIELENKLKLLEA